MKSQVAQVAQIGTKHRPAVALRDGVRQSLGLAGHWDVVCRNKFGFEKWRDTIENLVTNAGEDYCLDVALSGASQIATWYLGLTDGTPTAAETDTAASHAGWSEVTDYDEAARVTWSDGGVSSQSVSNSGSPADFSINQNSTTVGGAFLISENTKGGTTGTLFAVGAFTGGDKAVDSGDTLTVTATYTAGGS